MRIALFGATSKTGRYVAAALVARGHRVIAIGRSAERLRNVDARAEKIVADLDKPETIAPAIGDAVCVVTLAHARFVPALLAALPRGVRRMIATGSIRKYTALPDPAADAVRAGEAAFETARLAGKFAGVMLHPSMIYGAPDERNVNRVLAALRRWPRALPLPVPLPAGGRHRLQPVFVDDVVAAFVAAVERDDAAGAPIELVGPQPITYAAFVRACARAVGRKIFVLPMPLGIIALAGKLTGTFGRAELRRALEDKVFSPAPMLARLGVAPRSFEQGLREKLERGWAPGGRREPS
ncbi:MAG: SDR family oxidoreductase [Alphaproteobacteria bacterium]